MNRYYQHRLEIKKISEGEGCDVSVAARKLRKELNWKNDREELIEFDAMCVEHAQRGRLTDLFR